MDIHYIRVYMCFVFLIVCLWWWGCSSGMDRKTEGEGRKATVCCFFNVVEMKRCCPDSMRVENVDEEKMTNLWVLQFIKGKLVRKQYVQSLSKEKLTLQLNEGNCNLYFIANVAMEKYLFYDVGRTTEAFFRADTLSANSDGNMLYTSAAGMCYIPMLGEILGFMASAKHLLSVKVVMERLLTRVDFVGMSSVLTPSPFVLGGVYLGGLPKVMKLFGSAKIQSHEMVEAAPLMMNRSGGLFSWYLPITAIAGESKGLSLYLRVVGLNEGELYEKYLGSNGKKLLDGIGMERKMFFLINIDTFFSLNSLVEKSKVETLDRQGTANCYIANTPRGLYAFDAKVRGNGSITPALSLVGQSAPIISAVALNPVKVCVVWETGEQGEVIKSLFLASDGRVVFQLADNTKPGNALIAVRDDRGQILWSWHIWKVNYNPDVDYHIYEKRGRKGTFKMMKYNLGTTDLSHWNDSTAKVPGDLGLLYQWGRKDPFVGGMSWDYTASRIETTSANGYEWKDGSNGSSSISVTNTGSSAEASVGYAIQHPTHFILPLKSYKTFDWLHAECYADQRDNLWGNPNRSDEYINPEVGAKSIYDPCPPGWRVPSADSFRFFTQSGGIDELKNSVYGFKRGYLFYTTAYKRGSYAYWPALGCRNAISGGVLNYIGGLGVYQTSSTRAKGEVYANGLYFNELQVYPFFGVNRADALPVRCAKYN